MIAACSCGIVICFSVQEFWSTKYTTNHENTTKLSSLWFVVNSYVKGFAAWVNSFLIFTKGPRITNGLISYQQCTRCFTTSAASSY